MTRTDRRRIPIALAAGALLLAAVLAACATNRITHEPEALTAPIVERLGEKRVRIRWPTAWSSGPVAIYAGETPDGIDRTAPIAQGTGGAIELTAARNHPLIDDAYRLYYELVPSSGTAPVITAERRLPLQGPDNFRDLGGYPTIDGRQVRWGLLYRANDLAGITRGDMEYLSRIGLRLICDFRSDRERLDRPTPVIQPEPPDELDLPVQQEGIEPHVLRKQIFTGGIAALHMEQVMLRVYRSFVTDHSDQWKGLFRRIEDPDAAPLVFHCTAGKDRTGFAAALVLFALGVDEKTIFEDYLATNRYRSDYINMVLRWAPLYSLFRTEPADLLPLLSARSEYLQASLDTITELYGTVDGYLEEALGVTKERRRSLQRHYLRGTAPSS